MTYDELRAAEQAFRHADKAMQTCRERRNALILEAIRDGWTHAQISEATGLTRGRIGQIATGRSK